MPEFPSAFESPPVAELGRSRQRVRGGVVRAIDLPGVAILSEASAPEGGVPADSLADPTIRPVGMPVASGARSVEIVIESAAFGRMRIGDQTAWHSSWSGAREVIHALCSPSGVGLGAPTVAAQWLTGRPSETIPQGIDVRLGEGAFDGTRCALVASSGASFTARALEPSIPVYAFRTCEPPCRDAGSVILILPRIESLVMDGTEGAGAETPEASVRQRPFTLVELPLSTSGTVSLLGRVRSGEAARLRKELGLRGKGLAGDVDVAVELTRSASEASALVGVFVSRGLELPEVGQFSF